MPRLIYKSIGGKIYPSIEYLLQNVTGEARAHATVATYAITEEEAGLGLDALAKRYPPPGAVPAPALSGELIPPLQGATPSSVQSILLALEAK